MVLCHMPYLYQLESFDPRSLLRSPGPLYANKFFNTSISLQWLTSVISKGSYPHGRSFFTLGQMMKGDLYIFLLGFNWMVARIKQQLTKSRSLGQTHQQDKEVIEKICN